MESESSKNEGNSSKRMRYQTSQPTDRCPLCQEQVALTLMYAHLRSCMYEYETICNLPHSCYCPKTDDIEVVSGHISNNQVFDGSVLNSSSNSMVINPTKTRKRISKRKCDLPAELCDNPTKGRWLVIELGPTSFQICKPGHFKNPSAVQAFVNLVGETLVRLPRDESITAKCSLKNCDNICERHIRLGGHLTDPKKRLWFCNLPHLIDWAKNTRQVDWCNFLATTKSDPSQSSSGHVDQLLDNLPLDGKDDSQIDEEE
eukprot:TRINITY_DN1598_c0_g1_i1.p1 TRINITY_DN1598_c0_g1~~TRINITY_DN1598_c0_g1_i1.p1  ORF type:complete len:273 (+),score=65.71 TRINITY_DN1598_c0_g1_i1:44-820(+)